MLLGVAALGIRAAGIGKDTVSMFRGKPNKVSESENQSNHHQGEHKGDPTSKSSFTHNDSFVEDIHNINENQKIKQGELKDINSEIYKTDKLHENGKMDDATYQKQSESLEKKREGVVSDLEHLDGQMADMETKAGDEAKTKAGRQKLIKKLVSNGRVGTAAAAALARKQRVSLFSIKVQLYK